MWGSRPLWVPPQTSTIASHLPKAMGLAFSLARARRLGVATDLPDDAIVVCSFGDASANHATALAAINTARYAVRLGLPMPILFVCEDNGTGISVPTPGRLDRVDLRRIRSTSATTWPTARSTRSGTPSRRRSASCAARAGRPSCTCAAVRLWGHAGSDAEQSYRSACGDRRERGPRPAAPQRAAAGRDRAPRPATSCEAILADTRERVMAAAEEATRRPRLETTEEVVAPIAPVPPRRGRGPRRHAAAGRRGPPRAARRRAPGGGDCSPNARTLAGCLNAALADELARRPELLLFGEDVGRKGGVYNVTNGLQRRFGTGRVFDTLLDETSILGIAQGAAHIGLLPVPEIQYLAYLHNALDQIRGEAASLQFFSSGQFRNPMVVRVPGLAYQKGFGGHFHNDNSVGALRDIPGLVLAVPARGDDAARHAARRDRAWRPRMDGSSSSWSRSRSTTRRTSRPMATAAG